VTAEQLEALAQEISRIAAAGGGADAIAAALTRRLARRGRRAFWEQLASHAYADPSAARDDAAAHGVTPASHYVAVALEAEALEDSESSDALRLHVMEAFRSGDADVGLLERGAALVLLIPATREIDAANARTAATLLPRSLAKSRPQLRLAGGVGTRAPLVDAQLSIRRAETALTIARRIFGHGRVGVYEELGAYPLLLEGADSAALRAFADRILAPLRAYDEKHQTELERTLRLYFSVGQNVKTAAAQLFVHRHTVFYRLRQIAEICACKLDEPQDQLTLRMATAIDALTR
jgi:sugar diacid utilization regulator